VDSDTAARLRMAIGRLTRRLRRPGMGELTQSQLSALATIHRLAPVRLGDLATREGISASTISRVVDQLEGCRMVTRVRDPDDARSAQVSLTADGAAFLDDLRRNGTTLVHRALQSLDDAERAAVLAALPALEKLADRAEAIGLDQQGVAASGSRGSGGVPAGGTAHSGATAGSSLSPPPSSDAGSATMSEPRSPVR
jgi:DNA-binding MarR family transcriptional regulator